MLKHYCQFIKICNIKINLKIVINVTVSCVQTSVHQTLSSDRLGPDIKVQKHRVRTMVEHATQH